MSHRWTKKHIVRYLCQSVTLTGYGTATFERGIQTVLDVHAFFDQNIPANKLEACTIIKKCDMALGMHMSNRYFTPWEEATNEAEVTLTSDVDPNGILAGYAGNQFVHCEQNVVKYYHRKAVQGGAIKYIIILNFQWRKCWNCMQHYQIWSYSTSQILCWGHCWSKSNINVDSYTPKSLQVNGSS